MAIRRKAQCDFNLPTVPQAGKTGRPTYSGGETPAMTGDDGGRTKRITFYVSEDERKALKREAEEQDKSLSGYVLQLVRRQRQLDAEEEIAENLNPEERLLEIARQATDRIEESAENVESVADDMEGVADDVKDIHARAGTYPLVNFRLLMRQYGPPEPWVNDQFRWASTKLKHPLSEHDPLAGIGDGSDESSTDSRDRDGPTDNVDDLI